MEKDLPNFVGQRRVVQGSQIAKRTNIKQNDFDQMFDQSSEEESEEAEVEVPLVRSPPVPQPAPKPILRKADPRDRDNFRPIRGKELELAKQQFSRPSEVDNDADDMVYKPRITHISSEDAKTKRHNHEWDAGMRSGQFRDVKAISSNDLFQEQETTLEYFVGKLAQVKQTVTDALQEVTSD